MIHLRLHREDTILLSTLCARCPEGPAGCCVAPPEYDWSDVGRVVLHGGLAWILGEIARESLVPVARGLAVKRVKKRGGPHSPREKRCVFHGEEGCTIPHDRRPATCNYFLCEHAFRDGGSEAGAAREAHAALAAMYARWDEAIAARISEAWPEGAAWDAAFVAWLGEETAGLFKGIGSQAALGDDAAHAEDHAQAPGSAEG